MDTTDQSDVLAFLSDPSTYGGLSEPVERRETHISVVVLAGAHAYKLKRAVQFSYLDFSTPQLRLVACEHELELNRRTAPMLYLAVRRITREHDGRLAFDGSGELVDAVVEMNRFDDDTLFDTMARHHALGRDLLTALAARIAQFHGAASVIRDRGGAETIGRVLAINRQALTESGAFDPAELAAYDTGVRGAFAASVSLLDGRAHADKLRHCHGDLHLRNICLVDGAPVLFDCIEFDDTLARIDVLYDLAFVLMDLWHRDDAAGANWLLNRYLDERDEADGLPLLPLFMSLRAAIRAHVSASQARSAREGSNHDALAAARGYLRLARDLLRPAPARLVAIGGLSGSGKSTLAAALAPHLGMAPGARVIASDRLRKALFGVAADTRLPQAAYAGHVSETVYGRVFAAADRILRDGAAVVVEAVFDRPQDRARIEGVAQAAGVPFIGMWLETPAPALLSRVAARRGGPSDATTDVVQAQLRREIGALDWTRLDASEPEATVVRQALQLLQA